jgi:hypothetical protein
MIVKAPVVVLLLYLLSCVALSAHAEIYQCRDQKGRASFSQTPCPKDTIAGNSESHLLWREMQVLLNEGSAIYQQIGPDVKSILECKNSSRAFAQKLSLLDDRLVALPVNKGKHLLLAQVALRGCGQCQSSSAQYCENANKQLNLQMNVLLPPLAKRQ